MADETKPAVVGPQIEEGAEQSGDDAVPTGKVIGAGSVTPAVVGIGAINIGTVMEQKTGGNK